MGSQMLFQSGVGTLNLFGSYASDAAFVTANGTAINGYAYYNTTSNTVRAYINSGWINLQADTRDAKLLHNASIAVSVAANALTVAIKTAGGSDPSVNDPVIVVFRSATSTTGTYSFVTLTAASSIVVPSGTTIGTVSGASTYLYCYLLNNAGAIETALSLSYFDDGSTHSTTAVAGGTGSGTLYSTTARSNVATRVAARFLISEAAAGTWATAPTEISPLPFAFQSPQVRFSQGGGQSVNGAATITWGAADVVYDNWGMFVDGNDNWVVKVAGLYSIGFTIRWGATAVSIQTNVAVNGTAARIQGAITGSASNISAFSVVQQVRLAAGDTVSMVANTGGAISTNDTTFFMSWISI